MPFNLITPEGKKYNVQSPLAQGGTARVYTATSEDGRLMAIKTVITNNSEIFIEDCEIEEKIITRCKNLSYVMNFYEAYFEKNIFFVIMPMYNRLPKFASPKLIATWFYQLLIGLNSIHRKGVIHGDISGNNVMLSDDNEIRIIDFGISVKKGCTQRDIVPHIYKSKMRLEKTIEFNEKSNKRIKYEDNEEKVEKKFPEASPYDDLVAAAYTILALFPEGKLVQVKFNHQENTIDFMKRVLEEIMSIDYEKNIETILKNNCKDDINLYNYFYEFLTEILTFKNYPKITEITKRMKAKYPDIISYREPKEIIE